MSVNAYDKGDQVRVTGTWTNASNSIANPISSASADSVILKVKNPSGSTSTFTYGASGSSTVQQSGSSAGIYYADVSLSASGTWFFRFYSTGTNPAADETQVMVKHSAF